MVHRAAAEDPTLASVNFTNLRLPSCADEGRVLPKLMDSVAKSTHLTDPPLGLRELVSCVALNNVSSTVKVITQF